MKLKMFLASCLVSLLAIGCVLSSEFHLPEAPQIDKALLGTWHFSDPSTKEVSIESVTFDRKGVSNRYLLTFRGEVMEEKEKVEVLISNLNNARFLNLAYTTKEGLTTYDFYRYEVNDNTLKVWGVDQPDEKPQFSSQQELVNYFLENMDQKEFYEKPMLLVKK
ncbi:MAG: hypothetical protein RQ756_00570 [Flavobacteriaceae bacterium]|nr:hypothetical protein [Flavobacteriaceae bacterium]